MDNTEYKEGEHDDFIEYLFSNPPKEKGTVKLELPLVEKDKNLGLHEFEQLLMIFVDGLKYFFGKNGKVDINKLNSTDLKKVNDYFISMNCYQVKKNTLHKVYIFSSNGHLRRGSFVC